MSHKTKNDTNEGVFEKPLHCLTKQKMIQMREVFGENATLSHNTENDTNE